MNRCNAASGCSDTREDLQQRALPCSVQANDPDNLAAFDLEGNVFQSPDVSIAVLRRSPEASKRRTSRVGDSIAQGSVTLERSYPVLFAEIFTGDGEIS